MNARLPETRWEFRVIDANDGKTVFVTDISTIAVSECMRWNQLNCQAG